MKISEHHRVRAEHAQFLAAADKLGAAVRIAGLCAGQRVTWLQRGKPVEGVIATMSAAAPWTVAVRADGAAEREWRNLDQVLLA